MPTSWRSYWDPSCYKNIDVSQVMHLEGVVTFRRQEQPSSSNLSGQTSSKPKLICKDCFLEASNVKHSNTSERPLRSNEITIVYIYVWQNIHVSSTRCKWPLKKSLFLLVKELTKKVLPPLVLIRSADTFTAVLLIKVLRTKDRTRNTSNCLPSGYHVAAFCRLASIFTLFSSSYSLMPSHQVLLFAVLKSLPQSLLAVRRHCFLLIAQVLQGHG